MEGTEQTEAQAALELSFLALLSEGPLSRINVKMLCDHAHVARSTFYAYYSNISELQESIEDALIRGIVRRSEWVRENVPQPEAPATYFAELIDYIALNEEAFRTLLITNPSKRFSDSWHDALCAHFIERSPKLASGINGGLMVEAAASAVIGVYCHWLSRMDEVPASAVVSFLTQALQVFDSL